MSLWPDPRPARRPPRTRHVRRGQAMANRVLVRILLGSGQGPRPPPRAARAPRRAGGGAALRRRRQRSAPEMLGRAGGQRPSRRGGVGRGLLPPPPPAHTRCGGSCPPPCRRAGAKVLGPTRDKNGGPDGLTISQAGAEPEWPSSDAIPGTRRPSARERRTGPPSRSGRRVADPTWGVV